MRVLVTGAAGFIGKNLTVQLRQAGYEVLAFTRCDPVGALSELVPASDAIIHLAGENRPESPAAFEAVNVGLTKKLCEILRDSGRAVPVLFASSAQAELDNPYGSSKRHAEDVLAALGSRFPIAIYRLPGVFGKWCRPNYNSVVATFCHNVARDMPIQVNDPERFLRLVYVDDVVEEFLGWLRMPCVGLQFREVAPEYEIALGELATMVQSFKRSRSTLEVDAVGKGLLRALYATYVSYLPSEKFAYDVPVHADSRGRFVEMLKTPDAGQFSYFTARPGVTRGGHYHHTKTEKFLVLCGRARFGFRNILTNEVVSLETSGDQPRIVETIPGWAHDITNVGEGDLIVMLWANEIFDRSRPDTISIKVSA